LAEHLSGRVEDSSQHGHALEHLERLQLYANGFRVPRRFEQRIDDPAGNAAASQLYRGGQPDGPGARDEYLGFCGHRYLLVMLRRWAKMLRLVAQSTPDISLPAG